MFVKTKQTLRSQLLFLLHYNTKITILNSLYKMQSYKKKLLEIFFKHLKYFHK